MLIIKVIGGYYEREERPRCSNVEREDNRTYEDIWDWRGGFIQLQAHLSTMVLRRSLRKQYQWITPSLLACERLVLLRSIQVSNLIKTMSMRHE